MKYLVIENGNYADEFDLQAFKLIEANNKEELLKNLVLEKTGEDTIEDSFPMESYFGTNESNEWKTFEDFKNDLTVKRLTNEKWKILKSLFGTEFGVGAILR